MTIKMTDEEVSNYLRGEVLFSRKPGYQDQVGQALEVDLIENEEVKQWIEKQKCYDIGEVIGGDYDQEGSIFYVDFIIPMPIVFKVKVGGYTYLVNTEGSDYCRYVTKLVRSF